MTTAYGYRVNSGFTPTGTAADVVRYEQDYLGNKLGVSVDKVRELENYPASALLWVAKTENSAMRYTDDRESIEIVSLCGGEVIADDGDDGILVFWK